MHVYFAASVVVSCPGLNKVLVRISPAHDWVQSMWNKSHAPPCTLQAVPDRAAPPPGQLRG